MRVPDVNRSVLIALAVLFSTDAFKSKFKSLEHPMKRFSEWVETEAIPATKEIMHRIEISVAEKVCAERISVYDK